jgi:hypothetical protein
LWFFFPVPHTPSSRVGLGFAVGAVPSGRHLGVVYPPKKRKHVIPNEVREVRNPSSVRRQGHAFRGGPFSDSQSRRAHTRANRNYQGKNFFNPFFLLLDSF